MPETITTRAQMDALPIGAQMYDTDGYHVIKRSHDEYDATTPEGDGPRHFCATEISGERYEDGQSVWFPLVRIA